MRPIDADALEKKLQEQRELYVEMGMKGAEHLLAHDFLRYVWEAPTIDQVRHGKWIHDRMLSTSGATYGVIRCSECMSQYAMWVTNYCANCGAKMDGGKDEESEE